MNRNAGKILALGLTMVALVAALGTMGLCYAGGVEEDQTGQAKAPAAKKDGCCAAKQGQAAAVTEGEGECPHMKGQAAQAAGAAKKDACCEKGKVAAAAVAVAAVGDPAGGEDCCAGGGCPLVALDVAKMSKCAEDVNVTPEQKEKFTSLMKGATEKCSGYAKKASEIQRDLVLAVLNGGSEDDVREKIDAAVNLQAKAYEARVGFLKGFAGMLTPEQLRHLQGCASKKEGEACEGHAKKQAAKAAAPGDGSVTVTLGSPAEGKVAMVTYKCGCTGKTWKQAKGEKKFCPVCKENMPDCGEVVEEK